MLLGNGWFNVQSKAAWDFDAASWRAAPRLLASLQIAYADGHTEVIGTDDKWKCAAGPIQFNTIYGGEIYDARLDQAGWDIAGFDDKKWEAVKLVEQLHQAAEVAGKAVQHEVHHFVAEEQAARVGLRAGDLLDPIFPDLLKRRVEEANRVLSAWGQPALDYAQLLADCQTATLKLAPFIADTRPACSIASIRRAARL